MTSLDLFVSPLGRVEGDLDVRSPSTTVSSRRPGPRPRCSAASRSSCGARTRRPAHRVPRICGICGGSHLYKSAYALDTAWRTPHAGNATLIPTSVRRADAAVDSALLLRAVRHRPDQQELRQVEDVRRGRAPLRAVCRHQLPKGVVLSNKPVEVCAIFGGRWPHSSFSWCPAV